MKYLVKACFNTLFFPVRSAIKFSRPIKTIRNESKETLFEDVILKNEEQRLLNTFHLEDFYCHSRILPYKETLFILKLLEETLSDTLISLSEKDVRVLDIGSKSFSYVRALLHYFETVYGQEHAIHLDGVEIDAYRILADLHSRYDYAIYYCKDFNNVGYFPYSLLEFENYPYDYITWFLPFVSEKPLLNWGLPPSAFIPETLFKKALSLLSPNGLMLITNQTIEESKTLLKIIERNDCILLKSSALYNNDFSPFVNPRYVTLLRKA